MSNFSTALTEIVNRSFEGKWASLASKCGIDPSVISRLGAGKFEPTTERLGIICSALARHDLKQLLLAAARDRIPTIYQEEIFGQEDAVSSLVRANLSPDLALIIRYLETTAMTDELTASYLRRIGDWVGITSNNETALKVAEGTPGDHAAAARKNVTYRKNGGDPK